MSFSRLLAAILCVFCLPCSHLLSQAKPAATADQIQKDSTPSTQRYDNNDSLVTAFVPIPLKCSGDCAILGGDEASVRTFSGKLRKMSFDELRDYLAGYKSPDLGWPKDESGCKLLAERAIIVHVALWRTDSTNKLISLAYSNWQGYRAFWNGKQCLTKQPRSSDNSPSFYKLKQLKFIGVDLMQSAVDVSSTKIAYKVSTTPTVPQNIQDLGTLIEAVVGATPSTVKRTAERKTPLISGFLTVVDIDSTSAPPFSINISVSVGTPPKDNGGSDNQSNSKSPSQPVDCTDVATKGCSFSRQFSVVEAEYWDVAVGLVIPGVTEAVYGSTTTGVAPKPTLKHHTDAYALVDLYPFARFAPKQSYFPHINFGIPVTSQSLHRPYFGLSEDISVWAQHVGFPLDICIFGGLVDMKQQIYSPTSSGQLKWDRALRGVVGIELPVSQLASKLGGSKNKSSGGSGSGKNTPSN
jgi:hypothetical protein